MNSTRRLLPLLLFIALAVAGCDKAVIEAGDRDPVLVVAPDDQEPLTEHLITQSRTYLNAVTGRTTVVERVPAGDLTDVEAVARKHRAALVLVVDADRLAPDAVDPAELAGKPRDSFYLEARDAGTWDNGLEGDDGTGGTLLLAAGQTEVARQYAIYEAFRRLGVRFYHPEDELRPSIPDTQWRARARTPTVVARTDAGGNPSPWYTPDFESRGFTFHGAHPLEQLESFSDSAHPIDEARNVNLWIVKNFGESFRGAGRGVAPAERRAKRVEELSALKDLLGMRGGAGITLHNQQQGASASVDPSLPTPVQQQIEEYVTARLEDAPEADSFGIHFGPTEFTTTPDEETVQWINWAGSKALELRPDIPVYINDHITGSQPTIHYDDLGCPPGTNDAGTVDYYDLAFHTDPRLGVKVHTVMFYPLEGPARVYNQLTFGHKLCLMQKASAEGRPLQWFPEGSWWLSFDNAIPVYLPLYVWARHRDIELVRPLLASRGTGSLRGHRMFNSGQEWGYWQQDYAVGLWHWNADVTLDQALWEIVDSLCFPADWPNSCAARDEAHAVLLEVMDHQRDLFLNVEDWQGRPGGVFAYFSGEDPADVLGAKTGLEFQPVRVAFADVMAWNDAAVKHFRDTDLAALSESRDLYAGWVARLEAQRDTVPEHGKPWLAETIDGLEINRLRAEQTVHLYEAVLAYREAQRAQLSDPDAPDPATVAQPHLDMAQATLDAAAEVIARREAAYRYPLPQLIGGGVTPETWVDNGTTYPWRVQTKTHLMTYWHNRHDEVALILAGGELGGADVLRIDPALADPGINATIKWPELPNLTGELTFDGASAIDETVTDHDCPAGIWRVAGTYESDGKTFPVEGTLVRTDVRASTPAEGLTLLEPDSPTAQLVLEGIAPAFVWAYAPADDPRPARLAFAADLLGTGAPYFGDVAAADVVAEDAGSFTTESVELALPIADPATGQPAASVHVRGAVFTGRIEAGALQGPVGVTGDMVLQDIVDALIVLAGFDEEGAWETLAGVIDIDPADPPETLPFSGEFTLDGSEPPPATP